LSSLLGIKMHALLFHSIIGTKMNDPALITWRLLQDPSLLHVLPISPNICFSIPASCKWSGWNLHIRTLL
jgi:hypothetical protein